MHLYTYWISAPIQNVYSKLYKENEKMSYNDFGEKLEGLVEENEWLQEEMNRLVPILQASVFHSLLSGNYHSTDEIRVCLKKFNIPVNENNLYVVMIISMNDLDTDNELKKIAAQKVYLRDLAAQILETDQIYDLNFSEMGIMIVVPVQKRKKIKMDCEQKVEMMHKELEEHSGLSVSFHGNILEDPEEIPVAFKNVRRSLMTDLGLPDKTIKWYEENEKQDGFYYPIDIEEKLLDAILWGNERDAEIVLDKIKRHNQRTLDSTDPADAQILLITMFNSVKRIADTIVIEDMLQQEELFEQKCKDGTSSWECFLLLEQILLQHCHVQKLNLEKNTLDLELKVKRFIEKNYMNSQLSLSMVATQFQISEVYLSKLFKQSFDQNFSKYIESLRLNEAMRLLKEGNLSVARIAEAVGYNSPQSFRRAYKRVYGTTPTE